MFKVLVIVLAIAMPTLRTPTLHSAPGELNLEKGRSAGHSDPHKQNIDSNTPQIFKNDPLGIQSPCQRMIGVYNHLLSKVFRFHAPILRR